MIASKDCCRKQDATWIDVHLLAECFSVLCKKAAVEEDSEEKKEC